MFGVLSHLGCMTDKYVTSTLLCWVYYPYSDNGLMVVHVLKVNLILDSVPAELVRAGKLN